MEQYFEGHWWSWYNRGEDYLDKPPLLFWSAQVGYMLFGISTIGYKLFSVLSSLGTIWLLWVLVRDNQLKGRTILMTSYMLSFGFFYSLLDVKTDNLLVFFFLAAVVLFERSSIKRSLLNSTLLGLCIACGMLSKGPVVLILFGLWVLIALLIDRPNTRKYSFSLGYIACAFFAFAMTLIPYLIALYLQFDMHPEKVVNGRTGVSGVWFFLWEQSFGRITGESKWENEHGLFYFAHVIALFMLPYIGFVISRGISISKKWSQLPSLAKRSGLFVLGAMLLLGFSRYKLPHYIFPVMPFAFVFFMVGQGEESGRLRWLQRGNLALLITTFIVVVVVLGSPVSWLYALAISLLAIWMFSRKDLSTMWITHVVTALLLFGMGSFVLPPMMDLHQIGQGKISSLIKEGVPSAGLVFSGVEDYSLEFYSQRRMSKLDWSGVLNEVREKGKIWVYTNRDAMHYWKDHPEVSMDIVFEKEHVDFNRLTSMFKDREVRYILELERQVPQ